MRRARLELKRLRAEKLKERRAKAERNLGGLCKLLKARKIAIEIKKKTAATLIARNWRGYRARREIEHLRRERMLEAVAQIQGHFKTLYCRTLLMQFQASKAFHRAGKCVLQARTLNRRLEYTTRHHQRYLNPREISLAAHRFPMPTTAPQSQLQSDVRAVRDGKRYICTSITPLPFYKYPEDGLYLNPNCPEESGLRRGEWVTASQHNDKWLRTDCGHWVPMFVNGLRVLEPFPKRKLPPGKNPIGGARHKRQIRVTKATPSPRTEYTASSKLTASGVSGGRTPRSGVSNSSKSGTARQRTRPPPGHSVYHVGDASSYAPSALRKDEIGSMREDPVLRYTDAERPNIFDRSELLGLSGFHYDEKAKLDYWKHELGYQIRSLGDQNQFPTLPVDVTSDLAMMDKKTPHKLQTDFSYLGGSAHSLASASTVYRSATPSPMTPTSGSSHIASSSRRDVVATDGSPTTSSFQAAKRGGPASHGGATSSRAAPVVVPASSSFSSRVDGVGDGVPSSTNNKAVISTTSFTSASGKRRSPLSASNHQVVTSSSPSSSV
ncbi:unnamed protein product [Amoebophrya sp. A25]|nr:unnamed protein product [Amoebophrya sp. A25]|eukprot:GSA25T00003067001.1